MTSRVTYLGTAQRGLAALGRNQRTPLEILVVSYRHVSGYGDALAVFVKTFTMFEVSSIEKRR